MIEQNLPSWEDFEQAWRKLEADRLRQLSEPHSYVSEILYRGHADSTWKLETTLERAVSQKVALLQYYRLLCIAKPKIETFTEKSWQTPTFDEYEAWLASQELFPPVNFIAYDFLVYMRHHGFPSPLLDWSASPYVAAFFAMHHVAKRTEQVSIYAFCEYATGGKGGTVGAPAIHGIGPLVRAHRRHFLQQSQYTICSAGRGRDMQYASHEDVTARNKPNQDLLWKFNLPVSERPKVLGALNKMNINAFSLFGSEESLMDTIAITEILLRNHRFS